MSLPDWLCAHNVNKPETNGGLNIQEAREQDESSLRPSRCHLNSHLSYGIWECVQVPLLIIKTSTETPYVWFERPGGVPTILFFSGTQNNMPRHLRWPVFSNRHAALTNRRPAQRTVKRETRRFTIREQKSKMIVSFRPLQISCHCLLRSLEVKV